MKARILPPNLANLKQVAQSILEDQVVGMPTETVYGLAGQAHSSRAVLRIFEAKERPHFDPLIVHVSPNLLRNASGDSPSILEGLAKVQLVRESALSGPQKQQIQVALERFWPGPLTVVLPKAPSVLDLVTSGLETVAIRMPRHSVAQALIDEVGHPLAAPSANRFGRISPTSAQAVATELGNEISFILDGGKSDVGLESTVISVDESGQIHVLRPGGISVEELEKISIHPQILNGLSNKPGNSPLQSPGSMESHYAPEKPLELFKRPISEMEDSEWNQLQRELERFPKNNIVGVLMLSGDPEKMASTLQNRLCRPVQVKSLSLSGDLREAAQNLFSTLRVLDESDASLIFAEPCFDNRGLGFAISDRLKRASAKRVRVLNG